MRDGDALRGIAEMNGWRSPRLGIRFELNAGELTIYHPDGQPFHTFVEIEEQRAKAENDRKFAEWERDRQKQEREKAEQKRDEAEQEKAAAKAAAEKLRAQLRAMGVEPQS